MNVKDVLVINSYAGSLAIAATRAGMPIRGSYEDSGWGLPVQRANFPALSYLAKPPWPADDLRKTIVIAHPPCAAFSTQSPYKKGVDSDHFKPHKLVMGYALENKCAALAIESVPGILKGAQDIHRQFADEAGYNVFYIVQNAVTYGVPQLRPRVWTIFTKLPKLILTHKPLVKNISDILMMKKPGTVLAPNSEIRGALRCLEHAGYSAIQVYHELLGGEHIGSLLQIGKKILDIDDPGPNFQAVRDAWHLGGRFGVKMPRVLNPEGYATTILHDSSFFVFGRELYKEEYCRIMGFPDDYLWPGNTLKDFRLYLSKGVCPPVAQWVLEELRDNLAGRGLYNIDAVANKVSMIKPGEIASFVLTKDELKQRRLF